MLLLILIAEPKDFKHESLSPQKLTARLRKVTWTLKKKGLSPNHDFLVQ